MKKKFKAKLKKLIKRYYGPKFLILKPNECRSFYIGLFLNGKEVRYKGYERIKVDGWILFKNRAVNLNELIFPESYKDIIIDAWGLFQDAKKGKALYLKVFTPYNLMANSQPFFKSKKLKFKL